MGTGGRILSSSISTVSDTVTRPADTTTYGSADLVANSTTAADVVPLSWSTASKAPSGSFMVRRARLAKDEDTVANAKFRLHLFDANPTGTAPTNGDNGAIQVKDALTNHLGSFDFDLSNSPDIHVGGNIGVGVPVQGSEINVDITTTTIYGLLEARAAYAPANAEIFTVILEIIEG